MLDGLYLAYPIDQRGPTQLLNLFEQIEKFKVEMIARELTGWAFDPGDAFRVAASAPIGEAIARIDRVALLQADLVVAFLPAGVPSVGVPMEIDRARAQGKHVIVFSDTKSYMLEVPGVRRFHAWDDESLAMAIAYVETLEPITERYRHDEMLVKVDADLGTPALYVPQKSYEDDAGFDLVTSEPVVIPPGEFRDVPCGISVELPPHVWGLVTGRSSALRKKGLLIHSGIIDPGYRGPLFAGAFNLTGEGVRIDQGERVAQFICINNASRYVVPVKVDELNPSQRGSNGFGSTGS